MAQVRFPLPPISPPVIPPPGYRRAVSLSANLVADISVPQVLSSYFVLVLGIATIFFQVGSVKFGKRRLLRPMFS